MAFIWVTSQQQAFMLPRGHITAAQGKVGPPPLELLELEALELAVLLELVSPLLPLLPLLVEVLSPLPLVEPALLLAGIRPLALLAEPPLPVLNRPSAPPTPPQPKAIRK